MHAEIGTVKEPDLRVQIEQRAAFDQAPVPFRKTILNQNALSQKIVDARGALKTLL
jgi:Mg-chelatase subunit ChlI